MRQLPDLHNTEIERELLGGLLIDPDAYWRVSKQLSSADFYVLEHREVFAAIARRMDGDGAVDPVVLSEDVPDYAEGVLRLAADAIGTANAASHAAIIRDYAMRRELWRALETVNALVGERMSPESCAEIAGQIEAIAQTARRSGKDWRAVMRDAVDAIDEAIQRSANGGTCGVPTGIPAIDKRTGGITAPRLWCIAGRPGLGKSAMANQIALHAAAHGYAVGICSLEMGADEIGIRAMSHRFQINVTRLWTGDVDALEEVTAGMSSSGLADLPIHVDTDTFDLPGIIGTITEWRRKYSIALAIVDHIGLVEVAGYSTRNDQLGAVSRSLKKLCKRLDMPIIALSQLSRETEKQGRRPRLSDLRDSGNIEQDIDVAVMLHADPDQDTETTTDLHIGLLKNRGGRKGWLPEAFAFDGPNQTFREVAQYDYSGGSAASYREMA